jgi:hypothetical protein
MTWTSLIGPAIDAAASLGSAYLGGQAANRAAQTQAAAADRAANVTQESSAEALALQRQIYDQNRADLEPWRDAGGNALTRLMSNWGENYTASPSYNWRRDEAMRAVDAGMSARGLRNSTARDRAAARYVDGLASQDYDQWWNRGAGLAGVGQTATSQGVGLAANYANAAGANMTGNANSLAGIYGQAGNAAAAGQIGQANAWGGALQNVGDIFASQRTQKALAGLF